jgi:hypothetical protein
VSLVGITTSWMTLASVGRSVAFQKTWKKKRAGLIESSPEIIKKSYGFYPTTEDKQNMPWYGSIGSKSLLLSPPVLGLFLWLILLFTSIFF